MQGRVADADFTGKLLVGEIPASFAEKLGKLFSQAISHATSLGVAKSHIWDLCLRISHLWDYAEYGYKLGNMIILILLLLGGYLVLSEAIEAAIYLLLIFAAVWLLSLVIGVILMVFYVAVILAGIALAVMGLVLANKFIFKMNRKGYLTLYLLSLPISVMIIALASAALTGSGLTAQEATHTQVSYWYFWTRDVVSYHEIPTVWKRMVTGSLWVGLGIMVAFVIEYMVTGKTKQAATSAVSANTRHKRSRRASRHG